MTEPKYCVTAINRITRQRENISRPYAKATAQKMLSKLMANAPGKRAWIYPRVDVCLSQ